MKYWIRLIVESMKRNLALLTPNRRRKSMKELGATLDKFDEIYSELLESEDDFRYLANEYCMGEPEIRMQEVDAAYAKMKKHMKDIRGLALEAMSESKEKGEVDDQ